MAERSKVFSVADPPNFGTTSPWRFILHPNKDFQAAYEEQSIHPCFSVKTILFPGHRFFQSLVLSLGIFKILISATEMQVFNLYKNTWSYFPLRQMSGL